MSLLVLLSVIVIVSSLESNSMREEVLAAYSMGGALNDRCNTIKDCRPFGYVCRGNKTCQCAQWYIPDARYEKCVGGVNQRCLYDEHCIEGAYCENQSVCKCKDTSPFPLEDGLICSGVEYRAVPPGLLLILSVIIVVIKLHCT